VLVKGGSDNAAAASTVSLALERRYKGVDSLADELRRGEFGPTELARRLAKLEAEPVHLVGRVTVSSLGTEISAQRSMPVTEIAGKPTAFFDPHRVEYHVESSLNAQGMIGGSLPVAGIKMTASKTVPVYTAAHLTYAELPQKVREAQAVLAKALVAAIR
jgi:hypothetical protein